MYKYRQIYRDIDMFIYLYLNTHRFLDFKILSFFSLTMKGFKPYNCLSELTKAYKEGFRYVLCVANIN